MSIGEKVRMIEATIEDAGSTNKSMGSDCQDNIFYAGRSKETLASSVVLCGGGGGSVGQTRNGHAQQSTIN